MTESKQKRKPRKYTDEFKQRRLIYTVPENAGVISAASMIFPIPCLING